MEVGYTLGFVELLYIKFIFLFKKLIIFVYDKYRLFKKKYILKITLVRMISKVYIAPLH